MRLNIEVTVLTALTAAGIVGGFYLKYGPADALIALGTISAIGLIFDFVIRLTK